MSAQFLYRVQIVVEPDGTNFHAYCPLLKGLHTCGETEQEAIEHAKDAAQAYLMSLVKHHEPIPSGIQQIKGNVANTLPADRHIATRELEFALA